MDAKNGYNKLKSDYDKITEGVFYKYVQMPAVKKFLIGIKGKKVLDIGCGTGKHTELFYKQGAFVTGIDVSKEMIALAKKRLPNIDFKVGNMKSLPFKKNSFDILFYGLCVHYENDLVKVLKEGYRILKPRGQIIIITHNPYCTGHKKLVVDGKTYRVANNYFQDKKNTMNFSGVELTIYPKTISGLFNPIIESGFNIKKIIEPMPNKNIKKYDPKLYEESMKRPFLIIIEAEKV